MEPESRDPSCAGRYRCPKKTKNWGKGYPQPEKYEFHPYGALYGAAPDTPKNQPPNNQPPNNQPPNNQPPNNQPPLRGMIRNAVAVMRNQILNRNEVPNDHIAVNRPVAVANSPNPRQNVFSPSPVRNAPEEPRRIRDRIRDFIIQWFPNVQPVEPAPPMIPPIQPLEINEPVPNIRYPTDEETRQFMEEQIANRFHNELRGRNDESIERFFNEPENRRFLEEMRDDVVDRVLQGRELRPDPPVPYREMPQVPVAANVPEVQQEVQEPQPLPRILQPLRRQNSPGQIRRTAVEAARAAAALMAQRNRVVADAPGTPSPDRLARMNLQLRPEDIGEIEGVGQRKIKKVKRASKR